MADIRDVTERFAVAPQIGPEDAPALAGRFALLINNRPDGEEAGQPSAAAVRAAAEAAGLAYVHIPIAGPPSGPQVRDIRAAIDAADGPVLAFCRSGTRSIIAWALAEAAAGRPAGEVESLAAGAGYQVGPALDALLPRISG